MTCDAEGGIWVAHWNGWRITRFTPVGEVDRVIEMPVAQVTNCAFGGPDFDCLYITTAAINLEETALERQPLAGGHFAIRSAQRRVGQECVGTFNSGLCPHH